MRHNRMTVMLTHIANHLIRPFAPVLHRLGWLTPEEARAKAEEEATRLLEERKWKIEAALEIERRALEEEKQAIEYDRLALESYAMSIGVPLAQERLMH